MHGGSLMSSIISGFRIGDLVREVQKIEIVMDGCVQDFGLCQALRGVSITCGGLGVWVRGL